MNVGHSDLSLMKLSHDWLSYYSHYLGSRVAELDETLLGHASWDLTPRMFKCEVHILNIKYRVLVWAVGSRTTKLCPLGCIVGVHETGGRNSAKGFLTLLESWPTCFWNGHVLPLAHWSPPGVGQSTIESNLLKWFHAWTHSCACAVTLPTSWKIFVWKLCWGLPSLFASPVKV